MRVQTPLTIGTSLVLLVGLSGCGGGSGGGSPQGPSTTATPPPRPWLSGTTVTVVSGEDYAPVEGAQVTIGTRQYASDGAGQLVLGENAPYGTFVDIVADEFLARQTSVPRGGETRFVLWPSETASDLNEAFTLEIVYTYGWRDEPDHGTSPLRRLPEGEGLVSIWLSEQILQDSTAGWAHEQAVAEMNAALQGRATYALSTTRPMTGVVFESRLAEPGDEACASRTLGYFQTRSNSRGEITGGRVVYCELDVARSVLTVTHELGHTVGLHHTYGSQEMMSKHRRWGWGSYHHFSEREALAMRLLFERPAGNRFPDSDREVTASAGGVRTTFCYGTLEAE